MLISKIKNVLGKKEKNPIRRLPRLHQVRQYLIRYKDKMKLLFPINQVEALKRGVNAPNSTEFVEVLPERLDEDLKEVFALRYMFNANKLDLNDFEIVPPITTERMNAAIRRAAKSTAKNLEEELLKKGIKCELFKYDWSVAEKNAVLVPFMGENGQKEYEKLLGEIKVYRENERVEIENTYAKLIEMIQSSTDDSLYNDYQNSVSSLFLSGRSFPVTEFPMPIQQLIKEHAQVHYDRAQQEKAKQEAAYEAARKQKELEQSNRLGESRAFLEAYIAPLNPNYKAMINNGYLSYVKINAMFKKSLLDDLGEGWFYHSGENDIVYSDFDSVLIENSHLDQAAKEMEILLGICKKYYSGVVTIKSALKNTCREEEVCQYGDGEDYTKTFDNYLSGQYEVKFGDFLTIVIYKKICKFDDLKRFED